MGNLLWGTVGYCAEQFQTMVCVCHVQSHKAGLENFAEISQAFLFDTIEINRNENNWQDSLQTITVHANDSYKQKRFSSLVCITNESKGAF